MVFLTALLALVTIPTVNHAQILTFDQAKQRADRGDAFAQAVVALHYQLGWNTEKNPELAAKYATASAKARNPLGLFRLGALMRAGDGVLKDEQRGLTYQAASFDGLNRSQDPYSVTALGILIYQGKVVAQDVPKEQRYKEAARLYKMAADETYEPAMFNYAMCAEAGHGVAKDNGVRDAYVVRAHERGYPPATEVVDREAWGPLGERYEPARIAIGQQDDVPVFDVKAEAEREVAPSANNKMHPLVQQCPHSADWVAFSPDKRLVAVVSKTEIFIYETATGRLLRSTKVKTPPLEKSSNQQRSESTVFLRAYFGSQSDQLWLVCGSQVCQENTGDFLILWDLRSDEFTNMPLPVIGRVIGYNEAEDIFAVLSGRSKKLHKIRPRGGIVVDSLEMPSSSIPGMPPAEEEIFSAIFGKDGFMMLVSWWYFEAGFQGALRLIEFSKNGVKEFPWKPMNVANEATFSTFSEAVDRLLAFLEIPSAFVAKRKPSDYSQAPYDGTTFDLEKSISLGSQRMQLVQQAPFVSWALFSKESSCSRGSVASPAASFAEGVSASADGNKVLFWGIDHQDSMFTLDGIVDTGRGPRAWVAERPSPPTLFDLTSFDTRVCVPSEGNQVWNAKLSDDGQSALLVVSDLSASGACSVGRRAVEDGYSLFPAATAWVELHNRLNKIDGAARLHSALIWPFSSYTVCWMLPGIALQQTSVAFQGARYQSDYDRFLCDSITGDCTVRLHPYLFNDSKGWHRKAGSFPRNVTDRSSGIRAAWEVLQEAPHGLSNAATRLAAEDSATGKNSQCLIRGCVDAALPVDRDLICIQVGQALAMWNWSENKLISAWTGSARALDVSVRLDPWGAAWGQVQQQLSVSPDGRRIFHRSADGSIQLLVYSEEGILRYEGTIFPRGDIPPVFVTADNLYAFRAQGSLGIHFSDGSKTFPFEQFDLRLNRPDIVLKRLGSPPEAIAIAKELREKRLKRMGVTEEMLKPDFHVPELDIVGDVPVTAEADQINVSIKASDSKYPLERLKVFVNNVPVNGRDGELLREEGKSDGGLLGRITGVFGSS